MPRFQIRNWKKFQHFKDRRPPWIKLYRDLLDSHDWHQLDGESAKALVMLWLLASETDDGSLPALPTLAFRLRTTETRIKSIVTKLSPWLERGDINPISTRYQLGPSETETETETETEKSRVENKELMSDSPQSETTLLNGQRTAQAKELLAYLNEQTGHAYRTVKANLDLIEARLQTATMSDIQSVIDCKVREWKSDPRMRMYLRPDTLFRAGKFEQYLGQVGSAQSDDDLYPFPVDDEVNHDR